MPTTWVHAGHRVLGLTAIIYLSSTTAFYCHGPGQERVSEQAIEEYCTEFQQANSYNVIEDPSFCMVTGTVVQYGQTVMHSRINRIYEEEVTEEILVKHDNGVLGPETCDLTWREWVVELENYCVLKSPPDIGIGYQVNARSKCPFPGLDADMVLVLIADTATEHRGIQVRMSHLFTATPNVLEYTASACGMEDAMVPDEAPMDSTCPAANTEIPCVCAAPGVATVSCPGLLTWALIAMYATC